ncbi:MAG TPA: DUF3866 family protein [Clostridiales bacterium]|nr:DUF3866 family protein [Clostridiales bacterium]
MINYAQARVLDVYNRNADVQELVVETNNSQGRAVNYISFSGPVKKGDIVIINTTAVDLNLGSGGWHFVMAVVNNGHRQDTKKGHIIKLNYTPCQYKCITVEEQASRYHKVFNEKTSIGGMPVLIGELHSMLPPACCALKHLLGNKIKIAYIMVEGACLPINYSYSVDRLKEKGLLEKTITPGNALGGDLETVSVYNALLAAKHVAKADISIVTLGPGIIGTSTKYGFSGISLAEVINATNSLKGIPIYIPRISFCDARRRHYGISHHSVTLLRDIVYSPCIIPLPIINNRKKFGLLLKTIVPATIKKGHKLFVCSGKYIEKAMKLYDVNTTTMGRGIHEDKEFFVAIGSAAKYAIQVLEKGLPHFKPPC